MSLYFNLNQDAMVSYRINFIRTYQEALLFYFFKFIFSKLRAVMLHSVTFNFVVKFYFRKKSGIFN